MLFAATWMDLEIIILSELSQAKTNIMILLLCGIFKKIHKLIHKTEKDAQIQKINLQLPNGKGQGRDKLGGWD